MRILHITPYFAPAFCYGGPPRSVLGLCKALRHIEIAAEVFTTTANGKSDFEPSPVTGDLYDTVPVHYFQRSFPQRFYKASALSSALANVIGDYDLLHLHGLWNFTVWSAAKQAQCRGVPYIISPRGMLDAGSMAHKQWRKRWAYWLLERGNLKGAAMIHASSDAEAEMIQSYGLNANVFLLPNGVEMPTTIPQRKLKYRHQLNLAENAKLIVFLGRVHPVKRLDLLAKAFVQVRAVVTDAQLVIAGPNENNYRQQFEHHFTQTKESVHWLGEVNQTDKWSLLAEANALVMCSDSESFGMSVVEAMSVGLPVVVTRTCPWQEIERERCGFWVEQKSSAIAEALIKILANPVEAIAMGKRGQALVTTKYRWDAIAQQMANYYDQAIKMGHSS